MRLPWQVAGSSVAAHPLAWFFVLAFVISWATWPISTTGGAPPVLGFGPFLAAVIVLAWTEGAPAVRRLLRSMIHWHVPWTAWATALLLPVVLTGAAAGLNVALGAPAPTVSELGRWPGAVTTALLILIVPFIGGAWEEPGWRGFALPQLLERFSPLDASVLLGAVWALWHVPLLVNGDQHWSDLLLVIVAAIVFTWVFGNARSSVLAAMAMHAMNNAVSGEYVSPMFTGEDSTRQSWLLVLVWGVTAAIVVVGARGFRTRP